MNATAFFDVRQPTTSLTLTATTTCTCTTATSASACIEARAAAAIVLHLSVVFGLRHEVTRVFGLCTVHSILLLANRQRSVAQHSTAQHNASHPHKQKNN